jgi:hypothetical protein
LPPASAGFLLGLLLDPEDGGNKFLKKPGFLHTTQCYNPENILFMVTTERTLIQSL